MPLDAAVLARVRAAYELAIDTLGVPATFKVFGSSTGTSVVCGFAKPTTEQLAGDYNEQQRFVTFRADQFSTAPKRNDRIVVSGQEYVLLNISPVYINGVVVGYKGVTVG